MATLERFRKRFMFWLNINNPRDFEIAQLIADLKRKGLFTKTIRDGIKLICSLREGRVDVLLKMFPFVAQYFQSQLHAQQQQQYELMQDQNKFMEDQIAYLRGLLENGAINNNGNGHKQLPAPSQPKPVDDEPVEIVVKDANGSGNSSQNFKNSFLKYYGNNQ